MIAFTSGTTGQPKGTMALLPSRRARELRLLAAFGVARDGRPTSSPAVGRSALAFGLGGLLLFPLRAGAATLLLEKTSAEVLLQAIAANRVTVLFAAPTSYRVMAGLATQFDLTSLRKCVSAGEGLPAATRKLWKEATGIELIDGIGATELMHIFISHDETHAKPGATGKPVAGYQACVMDDAGHPLPAGKIGRLAVKGPTGCRYLADDRQLQYVQHGWSGHGGRLSCRR